MKNRGFLLVAVLLALTVAGGVVALSRPLGYGAMQAGLPLELATLFQRDIALQLAFGVMLAALLATALGFLAPALAWSRKARRSAGLLAQSNTLSEAVDAGALDDGGSLETLAHRLALSDSTGVPARGYDLDRIASARILFEQPLLRPAFAALVWLLPVTGLIASLLMIARGLYTHIEAQSVFVRLANEPVMQAIMTALACLALLSIAALGVHALVRLGTAAGHEAVFAIRAELDRLVPTAQQTALAHGFAQLAASQEATLNPAVDALRRSLRSITSDQTKEIKHLAEVLMRSFGDQMQAANGQQIVALDQSISRLAEATGAVTTATQAACAALANATTGQIEQISAAVAEARGTLAQQHGAQADTLGQQVATLMGDLKETLGTQAVGIGKMHEEAISLLREATGNTQSTTDILAAAITREQESAERVGQAAEQMHAAALASRETVERFIALAERMRELSRSIGSAVSVAASDETPLADPRTTRRLSSAIRELQRAADNGLPELK